MAVSIIHYSWQFFLTNNDTNAETGLAGKSADHASHHRVHHLNQKQYADTNYGGTFLLWDKLFGSYSAGPEYDVGYGVKNSRLSCNPMRESNLPFFTLNGLLLILAKRLKVATRVLHGAVGAGVILLFMLVLGYIQQIWLWH